MTEVYILFGAVMGSIFFLLVLMNIFCPDVVRVACWVIPFIGFLLTLNVFFLLIIVPLKMGVLIAEEIYHKIDF